MKGGFIFLILGVLFIVSRWRRFIIVDWIWIILCFALWFISLYVSVHKKNRERNTPKPVYITGKEER